MRMSDRYGLNLVEGSDIVNPLVLDVPNYERIDEEMGKNADAGVPLATELLTGTVHALTRENPNAPMFRFVATANFKTGDTFTVDGVQVTALLTTGEQLATGCYVINSNVLCCLVGTVLTMFCANSLAEIHAVDSDKLGGNNADYYASKDQVVNAINLAQNANDISLNNTETLGSLMDTQLKVTKIIVKCNVSASAGVLGGHYGYCSAQVELDKAGINPILLIPITVSKTTENGVGGVAHRYNANNTIDVVTWCVSAPSVGDYNVEFAVLHY